MELTGQKENTFGYQVGTFNQNLSVPYRVGHIWISGGYREQELIRFLQSWTHLDIRWALSARILSVPYRVGHIWIQGGHIQPEFIRSLQSWTYLDISGYKKNQHLSVLYRGEYCIWMGTWKQPK